MDATSPNRKSLFLNLVLFAAGSKLKQIPCSECKAAKLSISAADQKRREASLKRYERSHNSIHGVHCNHADTHSTRSAAMAVRRRNSFQSSNVDHYRMPAYKGYFAGRNLGLSQVWTEYFFYMDDDMVITETTKMDLLVSFLDKTNFHLVGVGIQDRLSPTTYLALGNKTHRCIVQKPDPGYYSEVRGFPGIYANDAVLNIFLASTNEAKAVGFDPHPLLARIGHNEFFLSALGRLRVAACSFCAVHHVRGGPVPGNYSRYRKPDKRFKAKLEKLQPIYA
ncbi:PREDICTED: beta-1,4 N-acetylgalactosaminyltransferase 1-like isoform X3 [Branchiostoma belcheri]|uniref:Beta-1,4 N-acetylgalactosaminyltransferase 1-like isoform X3 n=1 Tax=Branchiostoma belcheri TaxID=7741 RepID=A0A6P4Z8L8_BRABE|nr:PREDICTED: beta-1,4 N-acetylgalactosaminyltransferase 1-like isoform X3 [Branchiostoma belcheri]